MSLLQTFRDGQPIRINWDFVLKWFSGSAAVSSIFIACINVHEDRWDKAAVYIGIAVMNMLVVDWTTRGRTNG